MKKRKDELHENTDPVGLDEVPQIFNVRLGLANQTQEELKDLKNEIKINLKKAERFFIGEDLSDLENELNEACEMLYQENNSFLLQKVRNSDRIFKQWDSILKHPLLNDCNVLCNISERVSLLPNSEAGCEQTISKFNRRKNKFFTPCISTQSKQGSKFHTMDHQFIYLMQLLWSLFGELMDTVTDNFLVKER